MRLPIITRAYTVGPKGQFTLPAKLRKAYGIKPGAKREVFPRADGHFEIRLVRPSRILDYAGDLRHLHPHRKRKP
jgi:bifunctional DNA-binding transcriptional regulator/antitoxin component of YhaV-PrlF toxin-antitoxin module